MGRLCAGSTSVLASVGAALAVPAAADAAGFAPQYGGDQFMLYVSRPVGVHRGASTFGLRFERASTVSSDPTVQGNAPLRHHALVELQLTRGTAARIQFGNRMTWDLGSRQLAPTALYTRVWQLRSEPLTGSMLAAWTP